MQYSDLIAGLKPDQDGQGTITIPADWMQGRTTYGGLTAAISLRSARALVPDLPIRSCQIAFVGPVGGEVETRAELLRRGKNSAFVSADVLQGGAVMARSIFAFGAARESQLEHSHMPPPTVASPEETESFFRGEGQGPHFTQNFEMKGVLGGTPVSGSKDSAIGLWLRHRDEGLSHDEVAILALADCPPPAALSMQTTFAPISSMTWMAEFLSEDVSSRDNWYLAVSDAQTAHDGYSSQAMRLWNRDGRPILVGRQTIAMFG